MENCKKRLVVHLGELDNAGSPMCMKRMYWATRTDCNQNDDPDLKKAKFVPVAKELEANIDTILRRAERLVKGKPVDIGGYYHPNVQTR